MTAERAHGLQEVRPRTGRHDRRKHEAGRQRACRARQGREHGSAAKQRGARGGLPASATATTGSDEYRLGLRQHGDREQRRRPATACPDDGGDDGAERGQGEQRVEVAEHRPTSAAPPGSASMRAPANRASCPAGPAPAASPRPGQQPRRWPNSAVTGSSFTAGREDGRVREAREYTAPYTRPASGELIQRDRRIVHGGASAVEVVQPPLERRAACAIHPGHGSGRAGMGPDLEHHHVAGAGQGERCRAEAQPDQEPA